MRRTTWADDIIERRLLKQEAETAIRKLEECVSRVQRTMAAHGLKTTAVSPTLVESNFPDTASQMVDQYFSAGLHVQNPRDIERKAYARIAANKAPSKKGQQAKDCVVIESYLHIARKLREHQFQQQILFLTTNTRDYSERAGSGKLHPDLVAEFHAVNMAYAVNFPMAKHLLA